MLKQFVTEKEIEEVKKKRQEEWEKVRRPDQPLGRHMLICDLFCAACMRGVRGVVEVIHG